MDETEQIRLLRGAKDLHSAWYRETYPDVAMHGMEPAEHYLRYGAAIGRNPGKGFDTRFYLETYPDVAESGLNPLVHYLLHGMKEGRPCRPAMIEAVASPSAADDLPRTDTFDDPAWLAMRYERGPIPTNEPVRFPDLVSIIIPSYNNAQFLPAAIHSALSQVGVNVEVIVVDDGSTDKSVSAALQIAEEDKRLKVIPLIRNFGCYYARNMGVTKSKGQYIAFLDSDDILHPERFLRQLGTLQENNDALACICQLRRWTKDFSQPLRNKTYGENTILLRSKAFEKIGFFDSVRFSGDAEFRKRLIAKLGNRSIVRTEDELYFLRTLENSLTTSELSKVFENNEKGLFVKISPARSEYEKSFLDWHKKEKTAGGPLYIPFPQRKRSFNLYDPNQNASPFLDEPIVGVIATYPPRESVFRETFPTIIEQVDRLMIYLNEYNEVPDFLHHPKVEAYLGKDQKGDLRDNGKFFKIKEIEGYIFTLDDDILYPVDYVRELVHYIEVHNRHCVVGLHGVVFPKEKRKYVDRESVFHFAHESSGRFVDLIGTGTSAFHSSCLKIDLEDFRTKGICDLWFARIAHLNGVPLFAIPRKKKWLREPPGVRQAPRLYNEAMAENGEHTQLYHEYLFPLLSIQKPRLRAENLIQSLRDGDILGAAGLEFENNPQPRRISTYTEHPVEVHGSNPDGYEFSGSVRFHVVVNGWNCADYVRPCLVSLASQQLGNYTVDFTLIDDGSNDSTLEELTRTSLLPHAQVIRNTQNCGPAYARHVGVSQIHDPDTVVVLVDLDDELKPNALRTVAERYLSNPDCLMTIGNWQSQKRLNPHPFYDAEVIENQRTREIEGFFATHLRTFRRKLYDAITVDDLNDSGGNWLQSCTDVAIMYPLLDQCYARNVEFITEPIYFYNEKHSLSTLTRFGKAYKQERLEFIRNKPKKQRFRPNAAPPSIMKNSNAKAVVTPPTIIFGNPRSGTRMCANVLHQHPDICVTEETLAFHKIGEIVDLCGQVYFSKYLSDSNLSERMGLTVKFLWAARSSGATLSRFFNCRYVVNKTPQLEHRFHQIEEIFSCTPPNYVYCVRNAFDVLRSVKNLPNLAWNKDTLDSNLEKYLSSLRCFKEINRIAGPRIIMLNIDELSERSGNFDFYEPVFSLMGLRDIDSSVRERVDALGPQNSMSRVREKISVQSEIVDLDESEIVKISGNSEYLRFAEEYGLRHSPEAC